MLRLSLCLTELSALTSSSLRWSHGRWVLKFKGKGSRERTLPMPNEVRLAIKEYLALNQKRRKLQLYEGEESQLFQPLVNYIACSNSISP